MPREGKDPVKIAETEVPAGTNIASTPLAKKTFLQELKPWSRINPYASYIHLLLRPFPLIVYPAILFAFLAFSTTLAWVVCYVDTAASVYQPPPYLMNIGVSGLYNVPAIIGIIIGSYIGGGLTDLVAERHARRNNGVFEPESRLITLIIPFFLEPIGLLMFFSFQPTRSQLGMDLVSKEWNLGQLDSLRTDFCVLGWLQFLQLS